MSVVGAFLGVGLIVDMSVDNPYYIVGVLLALLAALLTGFNYMIIRKLNTQNTSGNTQTFYFFLIGAFMTLGINQITPVLNFHSVTKQDLWLILAISVTTFIHQTLITFALKFETAAKIMPWTYLPVLVSFAADILIFEMQMNKASIIGSLIVSGSVIAPSVFKKS